MTWIERYRRKLGLTRRGFAAAVTLMLGGTGDSALTISPALITVLEEWPKAVTHPRLANLLARACGATPRQRDGIVPKAYRGEWRGTGGPELTAREAHPWRRLPGATTEAARTSAEQLTPAVRYANQKKPVVVLDRCGNVVQRCESCAMASAWAGISVSAVQRRVLRQTHVEFAHDELYTFRDAAEWDAMSPSARAREIAVALRNGDRPGNNRIPEPVVVLTRDGRELMRYNSAQDAHRAEGVSVQTIYNRCRRDVKHEFAGDAEVTYRFAKQWDAMSPAEKKRDLG